MLFWLLTTMVFAFLVLHPYTTYPLSLVLLRRLRGRQAVQAGATRLAGGIDLVFCAYNEERFIARKLENCLAIAARYPDVRLHVFSDGSTDGTNVIVERYTDRLRFVAGRRGGKSTGMNRLLAGCDSELVVFTDANVLLDVEGIACLERYFSDPAVGCIVGQLIYVNAGDSSTASVGSLYWRLEEKIKELESNTGSVMGADGSIFAIRRNLFREIPDYIIDDYFTSFSILCDGKRIVRAPELLAYERTAEKRGEEFRRKTRIACRSFNAHRALWPRLRRLPPLDLYKYVSHKLVRWLTALWLLLGLLSGLAFAHSIGLLLPMLLSVPLAGAALIVAAQWARSRLAQAVLDIFTAYVATAYGIWRSLRGDRFQTWEVAGTTR